MCGSIVQMGMGGGYGMGGGGMNPMQHMAHMGQGGMNPMVHSFCCLIPYHTMFVMVWSHTGCVCSWICLILETSRLVAVGGLCDMGSPHTIQDRLVTVTDS